MTPTSTKITEFPPSPEVAQDMGVAPYDDFEDKEYDGTFDTSHFSLAFDSKPLCSVSQENGILQVQRVPDTNGLADCSLSVDRPISVKSDHLENMYASFLHKSDHQGGLASSTLTYDARFDDINVTWVAQCGVFNFDDGPFAMFIILHIQRGQGTDTAYVEQKPIEYDQWYRYGLEIDHSNSSLHCLVDNEELGNYSLTTDQYSDRLTNIRFLRWINFGIDQGTETTILLDDFYLIASQE